MCGFARKGRREATDIGQRGWGGVGRFHKGQQGPPSRLAPYRLPPPFRHQRLHLSDTHTKKHAHKTRRADSLDRQIHRDLGSTCCGMELIHSCGEFTSPATPSITSRPGCPHPTPSLTPPHVSLILQRRAGQARNPATCTECLQHELGWSPVCPGNKRLLTLPCPAREPDATGPRAAATILILYIDWCSMAETGEGTRDRRQERPRQQTYPPPSGETWPASAKTWNKAGYSQQGALL